MEAKMTPTSASASASHDHHHHGDGGEDKPHVTWDEETIAEHNLLRGTRQKIDEPNTPYHYYGSDQEEDGAGAATGEHGPVSPARSLSGKEGAPAIEWDELRSKLQGVQETKEESAKKKSEWDSSDDDDGSARSPQFADRDAEGKKLEKDPKFAEKRKSHYNEFERVKAWRQSHPDDDE